MYIYILNGYNEQFGEFNDILDIRQNTQLLTHVTCSIHLEFIGKFSLCYFRAIHKKVQGYRFFLAIEINSSILSIIVNMPACIHKVK
jgi:hypothetical protein